MGDEDGLFIAEKASFRKRENMSGSVMILSNSISVPETVMNTTAYILQFPMKHKLRAEIDIRYIRMDTHHKNSKIMNKI